MGHRRFYGGPQRYLKISCLVQKNLISFISIGELTKIEDSDPLSFFSEFKAKIALPEVKTINFFFCRSGQSLGKQLLLKSGNLCFRGEGPQSYGEQRWFTEQWAMLTFKNTKMSHGSEKVENLCFRAIISRRYFLAQLLARPKRLGFSANNK